MASDLPVAYIQAEQPASQPPPQPRVHDVDELQETDGTQLFRSEYARFRRVFQQRKARLTLEKEAIAGDSNAPRPRRLRRLFLLAKNEDPWNLFGLEDTTPSGRVAYCQRVYEISSTHFSPLHEASCRGGAGGHKAEGVAVDGWCTLARDAGGRIALHHACINDQHSSKMIRLLLKQPNARLQLHAKDNRGATPVQYLLEKMYRMSLKALPGQRPSRSARLLYETNKRYRRLWKLADKMLPLMMEPTMLQDELYALDTKTRGDAWDAVRGGHFKRLQKVWQLYPHHHSRDGQFCLKELGWTLLHEACETPQQDLQVVMFLISKLFGEGGRGRFATDQRGATPLHYAASRGWLEACVLLLDDPQSQEDDLLMARDARGRTPLHACLLGYRQRRQKRLEEVDFITTARYLAQQCPLALHVVDLDGFSPLLAISIGDQALVGLMVGLGASVYTTGCTGVDSKRMELACKAPWAPCGMRFHPHQYRTADEPRVAVTVAAPASAADEDDAGQEVVRQASPPPLAPPSSSSSMACERLHKVKSGHVEHPGTAMPMETLWFWVRRKHQRQEQQVVVFPAPLTANSSSQKPVGPHLAEDDAPIEPGRYGCRRFGAICGHCRLVPGDPEARHLDSDVATVKPANGRQGETDALSPLVLAIRCCRLSFSKDRMAMVETLLLAGAELHEQAVVEEALMAVSSAPQLLALVLTHSGKPTPSIDQLLAFICANPTKMMDMATRAATTQMFLGFLQDLGISDLFLLVPWWFQYGYFDVVRAILHGERVKIGHGDVEKMLEAMMMTAHSPVVLRPRIMADHLDAIVQWATALWPASCPRPGLLTCLVTCTNHVMVNSAIVVHSPVDRLAMDRSITSALRVLLDTGACPSHEMVLAWTEAALKNGWMESVKLLWTHVVSEDLSTCVQLMERIHWPLRPLDASQMPMIRGLVGQLIGALLGYQATESETPCGWISQCLALACAYELPEAMTSQIVFCVRQAQLARETCEFLSGNTATIINFANGLTPIQWLIQQNHSDTTSLFLDELVRDSGSDNASNHKLWLVVATAVLTCSSLTRDALDKWQRVLIPSTPPIVPSAIIKSFLRTRAIPWTAAVATTNSSAFSMARIQWVASLLVTFTTSDGDGSDGEDSAHWVYEMARWNAINLMKQYVTSHDHQQAPRRHDWARVVHQQEQDQGTSPLELCELLGHHTLARYLRGLLTQPIQPTTPLRDGCRCFGLLRTVMSLPSDALNGGSSTMVHRKSKLDPQMMWRGDWTTAVAWDDTRMLQALYHHQCPLVAPPSGGDDDAASDHQQQAIAALLAVSIQHYAIDALEWLLHTCAATHQLPAAVTHRLLIQAAKHGSVHNAKMTTLLLMPPYNFHVGRLAGDGTEVTLLHRAACFTHTSLASEIIHSLLQIEGCDINVRDGFGWTPVAYAITSGCLENACLLITQGGRLEAEYEGQSTFYYTLHLLPSYGWRWMIQKLLLMTRMSAFLHCKSGRDCACKGFEISDRGIGNGSDAMLTAGASCCSFCGHPVEAHTQMPYPPWFRDQYETYLPPSITTHATTYHKNEDEDDEDEEEGGEEQIVCPETTPVVHEEILEHERGRLNLRALQCITQLRFHDITACYSIPMESIDTDTCTSGFDDEKEKESILIEHAAACSENEASGSNLEVAKIINSAQSTIARLPLPPVHKQDDDCDPSMLDISLLPWCLRGDVAMLHPGNCRGCPLRDDNTTTATSQIHAALAKWLQFSATKAIQDSGRSNRVSTHQQHHHPPWLVAKLKHWRQVTSLPPTTTSTSTLMKVSCMRKAALPMGDAACGRHPVALDATPPLSASVTPLLSHKRQLAESVPASILIGPQRVTQPQISNTSRISILHVFVFHWRYARVYQCFCKWKRQSMNAQVIHHELETLADSWSADARRKRFQALVVRQRALEIEIHSNGVTTVDRERESTL